MAKRARSTLTFDFEGPVTPALRAATAAGIVTLLTLAMFGDLLFAAPDVVLSALGTDLSNQYVYWREFGFDELRRGNLALWNPYLFGGAPYFAGFQSALLYPPNWIHLVLPLAPAINLVVALHVWLAGLTMYALCAGRGLSFGARLTCAALFMFCGPFFLHVYPGHLSNLASMVWAPLVFLAVDRLFASGRSSWLLLGGVALALQILAGHPQYVYYTALVAGLHFLGKLAAGRFTEWKLVFPFVATFVLGGALAAIQLLPGLLTAPETVRAAGLPYEVASSFHFPPVNLVTLFAPGAFGGFGGIEYSGQWNFWEMNAALGSVAVLLVAFGLVFAAPRERWPTIGVGGLSVAAACGVATPLYDALYTIVPGFDRFRGVSKLIFPAVLLLVPFAGRGLDVVRAADEERRRSLALGAVGFGLALFVIGLSVGVPARGALLLSGSIALVAALLLFASRSWSHSFAVLALLAVVEAFSFARGARPTYSLESERAAERELGRVLAGLNVGDDRVYLGLVPNVALTLETRGIWGRDPMIQRRYAELLALTQGRSAGDVDERLEIEHYHPLLAMVRWAHDLRVRPGEGFKVTRLPDPMPRFHVVREYVVREGRDAVLAELSREGFDPRRTVVLESEPAIAPRASEKTPSIALVAETTDVVDVDVALDAPGILLVTDAYSRGWSVRARGSAPQSSYAVLPANRAIQAVPLAAGRHELRFEYRPPGFVPGAISSAASLLLLLGFATRFRRFRS